MVALITVLYELSAFAYIYSHLVCIPCITYCTWSSNPAIYIYLSQPVLSMIPTREWLPSPCSSRILDFATGHSLPADSRHAIEIYTHSVAVNDTCAGSKDVECAFSQVWSLQ